MVVRLTDSDVTPDAITSPNAESERTSRVVLTRRDEGHERPDDKTCPR